MSFGRLTILISGCSPGGMGAALAVAFHNAGHHVYATARNPSKLAPLSAQGIATLTLDVTSPESIESAVESVRTSLPEGKGLDMLVNNAAGSYTMPLADASIAKAKSLFEVNVWSHLAVTQAFLPLLLESAQPMIVNHTSVGSRTAFPFQGIYNASKAALAMLSETMRLELSPFGVRVVELKTAGVSTNIISNNNANADAEGLPEKSIYGPAREVVELAMSQKELRDKSGWTPERWAAEVSALLLRRDPPVVIWKGENALLARVLSMLPCRPFEGMIKSMTKLTAVEEIIRVSKKDL